MEDVLNAAFKFSEKLVIEADEKLLAIINSDNSKDIYLTLPDAVMALFERALIFCETFYYGTKKGEKLEWLNRVNIFPSVDWAITLYHKDYPQAKQSWMMVKLPIIAPIKVKGGKGERDIIYLNELINISQERIELN